MPGDEERIMHDIFLSYPHSEKAFATKVRDRLFGESFTTSWDENFGGSSDHRDSSTEAIRSSRCCVLILGPGGMCDIDGEPTEQFKEFDQIIREEKRRNTTAHQLGIFVLLMQCNKSGTWSPSIDQVALPPGQERRRQDLEGIASIMEVHDTEDIGWFNSLISSLSNHYVNRDWQPFARRPVPPRPEPSEDFKKPERQPRTEKHSVEPVEWPCGLAYLPDWARVYIDRHFTYWAYGNISEANHDGFESTWLERLPPHKLIELRGTRAPTESSEQQAEDKTLESSDASENEEKSEPEPIIDLLMADKPRFLFLDGRAGAGKTMLLTRAAAANVALLHDEESGHYWSLFGQSAAKFRAFRSQRRFPIVLECKQLANHFLTSRRLIESLAAETRRLSEENLSAEDFDAFLSEVPCLLLLDGIEEIVDERLRRRLMIEATDLSLSKKKLKIAISGRTSTKTQFNASVVRVHFTPLSVDDMFSLADCYAELAVERSETVDKNAFRHRVEELRVNLLRTSRGGNDASNARAVRDVLETPLMSSLACMIAAESNSIPRHRSELCHEGAQHLLKRAAAVQSPKLDLRPKDFRKILRGLAFQMFRTPDQRLMRSRAKDLIGEVLSMDLHRSLQCAHEVLVLLMQTGLVEPIGNDKLMFRHAVFLEFFTTEYVVENSLEDYIAVLQKNGSILDPYWRLVVVMLPGALRRVGRRLEAEQICRQLLAFAEERGDPSERKYLLELALDVAQEEPTLIGQGEAGTTTGGMLSEGFERDQISNQIARLYSEIKGFWPLHERSRILSRVASAGAPLRFLLNFPPDWIAIKGDPGQDSRQAPFDIWGVPVIVREYDAFLQDCDDDEIWPHVSEPEHRTLVRDAEQSHWLEQLRHPTRPVTMVTWYEAVAYCLWYTRRARNSGKLAATHCIRLPTRQEWLRVARRSDPGATYPWGDQEPGVGEKAIANSWDSGLRAPSPIGLFSSYCQRGLYDFGSNVCEWAAPDELEDGDVLWPPPPAIDSAQVLGGSWASLPNEMRTERQRIRPETTDRSRQFGFRLVRARCTHGTPR